MNVYDATKYGIESNWVENGVDVQLQNIDEVFEERIKKK